MVALIAGTVAISLPSVAGEQDFTVHNETGMVIDALYVSEANNNKWEEDILGQDTLADGDSTDIEFKGYGDDVCAFDIRIDDESGKQWIIEDINLCEIHKVAFSKEGSKVVYTKE
jgi:hypothetical protein